MTTETLRRLYAENAEIEAALSEQINALQELRHRAVKQTNALCLALFEATAQEAHSHD